MVQSETYCVEQIFVPENFPNTLKTYAKDVIRTQPYDLLRWSAAYFRCLAMNVQPPVKNRMEKVTRRGTLTREYLRVLVEQIGRGYFVGRDVLQRKWENLCLPQEELLKYLSLSRMYNWSQVHWLKLFVVMIGSLNESFEESMIMLCELLTDDVEGSLARIPMWMFRVCYVYLAELDCSEEQTFINGRKKLITGDLEQYAEIDVEPRIISISSLQQEIFSNLDSIFNRKENAAYNVSSETMSDVQTTSSSQLRDLLFSKFGDSKNVIQQGGNFASLIVLLDEANSGAWETKVLEARQKQSEAYGKRITRYLQQEMLNATRSVGPPWSWLNQFIMENCIDQSFNFVEYDNSTMFDETVSSSSDQSFEKRNIDLDSTISKILNKPGTVTKSDQSTGQEDVSNELEDSFKWILSAISLAASEAKVSASEISTVINYLEAEKQQLSSEAVSTTDYTEFIKLTLKYAAHKNIKFENVNDLISYIKEFYLLDNYKDKEKEFFKSGCFHSLVQKNEPADCTIEKTPSEEGISFKCNIQSRPTSKKELVLENGPAVRSVHSSASETALQSSGENILRQRGAPLRTIENAFVKSGLETDPQILANKTSDELILGVIKTNVHEKDCDLLPKDTTLNDSVDVPSHMSSGEQTLVIISEGWTKSSLSSQKTGMKEQCTKKRPYICGTSFIPDSYYVPPDFICLVQACPGIGPVVSKETTKKFLTYIKAQSVLQKGMVMPRNFKEKKCPFMIDPN